MILADVSIKRPVFITVIFIVLLIVGIQSYLGLTINDMPQADSPYVTVTIVEKGASAEQLESKVAKTLEEAVGQISGIKHIYTTMKEGVSQTIIEFDLEKSPDAAAQEVKDKVGGIRGNLPADIEDPIVVKYDPTAKPIISLALTGRVSKDDLSQLVDDKVTKKLYTVKGVGGVAVYGNVVHEIQIKLDIKKLEAYGVSTSEVITSLKSDNLEIPGGKMTDGSSEISLRTNANVKSVQDFNNILVAKRNGKEIRVIDVADVVDGFKDKESISHYKGEDAIGIDIIKQSGANTVATADEINKAVSLLKDSLPKGVQIDIVKDNSIAIRASVDDVVKTIVEGCLLAIFIVFLFLKEWESTLISAVSLPTSIITTFIGMKIMNFSLNTLTLIALSLAVGLLIDDGIVVIENIIRHLHMGKAPLQAAKDATTEIGLAVLATTFAVVAVFLPVAMVTGIIGKYFIEFGLTVVFSMLVSLFVSFTIVPMMSSRLLKSTHNRNKTFIGRFLDWFNHLFDILAEKYGHFLTVVLRHRLFTVVLAVLMFISAMMMIPSLGFTFLPSTDNSEISIIENLDSGWALEKAELKAKEIEAILGKYPEISYTYTTLTNDNLSIFVKLVDKSQRNDSANVISAKIRTTLKSVSGVETTINAVSMGPAGGNKDVALNLVGDNFEELQAFALKAKNMMRQDPHAVDVGINYESGKSEATIDVNRDKAVDLGVNSAAIADTIRTLFNGVVVSKFDAAKDRYDVRISIKDDQRQDLNSLDGIYVTGTNYQMVPLSQVTNKVLKSSASVLHRYDRTQVIELSSNVSGMPTGDFINYYQKKLQNEMNIPKGVAVELGGSNQTMQEGFNGMVAALIMGILFIYLVMAAQFESFIDPISIMFALPMAMIGAILALYITGTPLSIIAVMGIILLMGIVAKNAILLIDFALQRRREGLERNVALVEAGTIRLRPILMTTLAMIFGMIPLAVAQGTGTEMRAPMAYAVIGGLITSTLLTLFVVPVIYALLDDVKKLFVKGTVTMSIKKHVAEH